MRVRSFVAFDISEAVRTRILKAQNRLRPCAEKINWVDPEHFHLTLKFCGNVYNGDIVEIANAMKENFQGRGPFTLAFPGIGTFPSLLEKPNAPVRVIWAAIGERGQVQGGGEEPGDTETLLKEWASEFDLDLMDRVGIRPESRGYLPHITIGRVKSSKDLDILKKELITLREEYFGECLVTKVVLYESRLSPKGPTHIPLSTVTL